MNSKDDKKLSELLIDFGVKLNNNIYEFHMDSLMNDEDIEYPSIRYFHNESVDNFALL